MVSAGPRVLPTDRDGLDARRIRTPSGHAGPLMPETSARHPATPTVPAGSAGTSPTGSAPTGSDRLPQGMVEDAAKRLGWLALVVAIIIPCVQIFQRFTQPAL